jgi:dTDP-4-dehydrorhamnose 3,5-epimerase
MDSKILIENSEVLYHMSEFYRSQSTEAIRWDEPAFGIRWPLPVTVISD